MILNNIDVYKDDIASWVQEEFPNSARRRKWRLCYRAKGTQMHGLTFHRQCDGKRNTLSIIKNVYKGKTYIYGGFQDQKMKSKNGSPPPL